MAKDRKPDDARPRGGATRSGGGNPNRARTGGRGGRTRPPTQVVANAHKRPWGLIAGAVAVVVFAAAVIGYAVAQVNEANANKLESIEEISGVQGTEYAAGQDHVTTEVDYTESPPVGGPHDGTWADCTGTVYDVDIRHENAVHSLEHGGVWITYNPDEVSDADVDTLADLVDGESGWMLSPYAGLDSPISVQSWNQQLKVDSVADQRLEQFADLMAFNSSPYADDAERNEFAFPEPGATCENPAFAAEPLVEEDDSTPVVPSDPPATEPEG